MSWSCSLRWSRTSPWRLRTRASGCADMSSSTAVAALNALSVRRRLKGDVRFWIGFGTLLAIALTALFAPLLAPYDPNLPLDIARLHSQPPSFAHPLGTDTVSRDVLSR